MQMPSRQLVMQGWTRRPTSPISDAANPNMASRPANTSRLRVKAGTVGSTSFALLSVRDFFCNKSYASIVMNEHDAGLKRSLRCSSATKLCCCWTMTAECAVKQCTHAYLVFGLVLGEERLRNNSANMMPNRHSPACCWNQHAAECLAACYLSHQSALHVDGVEAGEGRHFLSTSEVGR